MSKAQSKGLNWSLLLPRLAPYLPAGLFNRLRILPENLEDALPPAQAGPVGALREAVEALESLYRVLVNYLPRYLLELEPRPGQPHGEIIEGSFIFADITGFTALTELLARQGQARGREVMNQIVNRLFASILDPLFASGGDLLIFAGDAVLAYFPKQHHNEDLLQAVRAGLRMQREILPFGDLQTEFGRCSLAMSIGVEQGRAFAGVVGTPQRMELLVSGPAIGLATRAEEKAKSGQVVLGPQARKMAQPHFRLAEAEVIDDLGSTLGEYELALPTRRSGGTVLLGLDPAELLDTLDSTLRRIERLAPFLPEDLLAQLANTNRRGQHRPEFRPVASQFINIIGLEDLAVTQGPDVATAVLQRYFVRAQETINRHEGVISQVDAYGDSFFLLNTFGAPKAHQGTRRYAVSAALKIAQLLDQVNREFGLEPPLRQRAGITYGLTLTGEIGARYRRESVIAGPAVNRAARLMSKAQPGQVILDADIWQNVQAAFVGEPLSAVSLKGIDRPVVIVNVQDVRLGRRLPPPEQPLLDREKEQRSLTQALTALRTSPSEKAGSAWLVTGETGLGKSSLIAHLAHLAKQRELTVLVGRCQPHGRHSPLFPWIDLLAGWLDVDERSDPEQQRGQLTTALASLGLSASEQALANLLGLSKSDTATDRPTAISPNREKNSSILAALSRKVEPDSSSQGHLDRLNQRVQDRLGQTEEAEAISPKEPSLWQQLEKRVNGVEIIDELLKELAQNQRLVIILEDIDWADPDSLALLDKILAKTSRLPLMVVVTGKETVSWPGESTRLPLSPLSDEGLVRVAQRALGARKVDEALAQWICQQARGNPLYAQELCRELLRSDGVHLDRSSGEVYWTKLAPTLPLSLHQLLLARLETLSLDQQELLKRAAILGLSFELEGVLALCRDQMNAAEGQKSLEEAVRASFLQFLPTGDYQFSHPLMQQAIYSTISFAQRQTWHTQVGDWLVDRRQAQAQTSEGRASLEMIAYHYLRGTDADKAAYFGRRAGDRARAYGAYESALAYYQEVLALEGAPAEEQMKAAKGQADLLN